jgi:integrase/recombinase XerD
LLQVTANQQISKDPPEHRTSLVRPAAKKTHYNNTKYLETEVAAAKSLTPADIERVLHYISNNANAGRNRCMFLVSVMAGLRVGEIAALTLADVRAADGTIKSEIYLAAERVKHGHARTVFISTRLQQVLAEYVTANKWYADDQPLFHPFAARRRHFTANTLAQYFYWMYKRAGITSASSHSGRKTFLTSLAAQGVSVFVLASLAGHKSIATTQKYVTVNDDVKRKAVELV